jgi:hypothetical protein
MVVIQIAGTPLGSRQIPSEMDLVLLVMASAIPPLMFQYRTLLVMLMVIVLIRDSQIEVRAPSLVHPFNCLLWFFESSFSILPNKSILNH